MTTQRPVRYRDILAMLKQMARDDRVPSDGLRAVLAGNVGERYMQADIQRTRELAALLGWELDPALEPADPGVSFDTPERYQEEVRRLHAALRTAREQVRALERASAIALEKSTQRHAQRQAQMQVVRVRSINQAFARLGRAEEALSEIALHGAYGAAWCVEVAVAVLQRCSEEPPSTNAVDPSVADPGTPPTRDTV